MALIKKQKKNNLQEDVLNKKERYFNDYYSKHKNFPICPICDRKVQMSDLKHAEYVKARSGNEMFFHRSCFYGKKMNK